VTVPESIKTPQPPQFEHPSHPAVLPLMVDNEMVTVPPP
jgi:hypothetical protein